MTLKAVAEVGCLALLSWLFGVLFNTTEEHGNLT